MSAPAAAARRDALLRKLLDGQPDAAAPASPIPRRAEGGSAPLSFSQERFWFLDRLSPGNPFYVESVAVPVPSGTIDLAALETAIRTVVGRHEVLRTRFEERESGAVQIVLPDVDVPLRVHDVGAVPPERRDGEVTRLLHDNATSPFDLSRPPLFRFMLICGLEAGEILAMAVHHIVSDGWSMRILQREINEVIGAIATGSAPRLPPLPIQYGDFAAWQRNGPEGGLDGELDYWRGQLAGLPALELPLDRPRPRVLGFRGAHEDVGVPLNISSGARVLAGREGATLFMVALAAFAVVLGRHSGQDEVVVGTPVAGRSRSELEPLIGLFLNTVVLRIDLAGDPTFRELIARVRKVTVAAFDRQDTPFERVVEALQPDRDLGRNPLFQVLFQLYTPHDARAGAATEQTKAITIDKGAAILDLSVHLAEGSGGIQGRLEYSTELFETATIRRIFEHFVRFLAAALATPGRRLSDIEILSGVERADALAAALGPNVAHDVAPTVPAAFARAVAAHPDRLALIDDGAAVTFSDLDRRVQQIAAALAGLGVGRGDRVAICLERSADAVAAMLATMWLGAAYVAIDPDYPQERIAFVIGDSDPRAVVTVERHRVRTGAAPSLVLDGGPLPDGAATPAAAPADVAYLVYTSGSTGRPKGVMATHEATMNRFAWMWRRFPFADGEVACLKTAIAFVDSVWETFGPLLAGVPSVILGDEAARDPAALCATLAERRVTRLLLVPSLLRAILDARIDLETATPRLSLLFTSGEQLTADLLERVTRLAPSLNVINLYGSSEVAGDVTCAGPLAPRADGVVPIGAPLDNCQAYVLDARMQPAPRGALGQLHVGGLNLARGYFRQPALTAERFVPDPFGKPGARMFATGDLARVDPTGALVFEGRRDHQVKLRGHRIELGEVEAALQDHAEVGQAVVVMSPDGTGGRLDAWLTSAGRLAPDEAALRRFLAERLPAYMVPASFTVIEAFPLLPNGKLDRGALRDCVSAGAARSDSLRAPETDTEIALAALWSDLLGRPAIGRDENFFDIGGHSLLATRLVTIIRDRFDLDLPLTTVFLRPTLRELAGEIERLLLAEIDALADAGPSVDPARERGLP
ncbi:amino acid adenylation domain-containing protein [Amaricoccus sp.]|uniref:amino acid adenylation domain-containing protein n=1 Tax=Amaricoccus sp. TaxID=1872485 RepID=UPI001B70D7F6|nr:amino acid adenylation domain-containing protein [Amaricoccus sp.]MBP7241272.1 amino acid adenylation domain-containing protein [Amaricoccus sp.]